jgi:hypothetical protein
MTKIKDTSMLLRESSDTVTEVEAGRNDSSGVKDEVALAAGWDDLVSLSVPMSQDGELGRLLLHLLCHSPQRNQQWFSPLFRL